MTEATTHDPVSSLSPTMLEGHVAFITGGGSGINLGIARAFARCGAKVAICGRTEERLATAAEELRGLGAEVAYQTADVRDPEALQASVDHAVAELGDISIAVAGAAGNFFAQAEKMSPNAFRTVVDIDLMGAYHTARATFPSLKKTRGSILFISAGQAYKAMKYQAHVGAAKAGIEALMKNLAVEWGPHGIRSNSLVPGPVEGRRAWRGWPAPPGTRCGSRPFRWAATRRPRSWGRWRRSCPDRWART